MRLRSFFALTLWSATGHSVAKRLGHSGSHSWEWSRLATLARVERTEKRQTCPTCPMQVPDWKINRPQTTLVLFSQTVVCCLCWNKTLMNEKGHLKYRLHSSVNLCFFFSEIEIEINLAKLSSKWLRNNRIQFKWFSLEVLTFMLRCYLRQMCFTLITHFYKSLLVSNSFSYDMCD